MLHHVTSMHAADQQVRAPHPPLLPEPVAEEACAGDADCGDEYGPDEVGELVDVGGVRHEQIEKLPRDGAHKHERERLCCGDRRQRCTDAAVGFWEPGGGVRGSGCVEGSAPMATTQGTSA